VIPTGIPDLDNALGGGIPPGTVEIFGPPTSGRSSLALSVAKEAMMLGKPSALIPIDEPLHADFVDKAAGEGLLVVSAEYAEGVSETLLALVLSGVKLIVVDSTSGLVPIAEAGLPVGERIWSAQRRLLFHTVYQLSDLLREEGASILFLGQLRTDIRKGAVGSSNYDLFTGLAQARIRTKRKAFTDHLDGARLSCTATVVASKRRFPGEVANFTVWSGRGVDRGYEYLKYCARTGIAKRAGVYWKLADGTKVGPGYKEAAAQINEWLRRA
jgi:recombination protein RecA